MKTETQIKARIIELRDRLDKNTDQRKAYAKQTGANRTTLGVRSRREYEGQIEALEWVLDLARGTRI
jgi:hypothetical protein